MAGRCGAEVCALEAPRQNPNFLGTAQCKHPCTRYPKTLWRAYLVQRYAHLERHAKTPHSLALPSADIPILGIQKKKLRADLVHRYARLERHAKTSHFLALRISNIPILGIQKHVCGQMWCGRMHAWSATPKPYIFWHCAVQTTPS